MRKVLFSGLMLVGFAAPAALAAGLSATQTVERQVQADGEAQWVPAGQAASGDRLRFAMSYWISADHRSSGASLVVPVPGEVRFVEDSATSDGLTVMYSVDGGVTYSAWDALTAGPAGVTHVRWTFPSGARTGQTGVVSYEAIRE